MIERFGPFICFNHQRYESNRPVAFSVPPVYEVIRLMDGVPLFYKGHMARLKNSLVLQNMDIEVDDHLIYKDIEGLYQLNDRQPINVRIEIGLTETSEMGILVFAVKPQYPAKEVYGQGVLTVLAQVVRTNPHAKVYYESYQKKIADIKSQTNAFEVLLYDEAGKISEGSRSNVFFIKGKTLYSPKSEDVLLGISRSELMAVIADEGISYVEKDLFLSDVTDFEACFLSGTSIHLLPISQIDQITFESAKHPLMKQLLEGFIKRVHKDIEETKRGFTCQQ